MHKGSSRCRSRLRLRLRCACGFCFSAERSLTYVALIVHVCLKSNSCSMGFIAARHTQTAKQNNLFSFFRLAEEQAAAAAAAAGTKQMKRKIAHKTFFITWFSSMPMAGRRERKKEGGGVAFPAAERTAEQPKWRQPAKCHVYNSNTGRG